MQYLKAPNEMAYTFQKGYQDPIPKHNQQQFPHNSPKITQSPLSQAPMPYNYDMTDDLSMAMARRRMADMARPNGRDAMQNGMHMPSNVNAKLSQRQHANARHSYLPQQQHKHYYSFG